MFSEGHLIWIGISALLTAGGLFVCIRRKLSLQRVMTVCLVLGVISEIVKVFSVSTIVPVVDPVIVTENGGMAIAWMPSGEYTPYLAAEHLPFELCTLYIGFMFLALILKNRLWKKRLYAVMFASGTLGGLMGIVLASITAYFDTVASYFSSVRVWQYFLFHAMIVTISLYLGICEESGLSFPDWKKAVCGLVLLDLPTFYLNSLLSSEVYVHDKVVGVTHRINFFSSYVNPLGLALTEKWQWIVYLLIRGGLAVCLILFLYWLLLRGKGAEYGRRIR